MEESRSLSLDKLSELIEEWQIDDETLKSWFDSRELYLSQIEDGYDKYSKQTTLDELRETTVIALGTREPEPVMPNYYTNDDFVKSVQKRRSYLHSIKIQEYDQLKQEADQSAEKLTRYASTALTDPNCNNDKQKEQLRLALEKIQMFRNIKLVRLCPDLN